MNYPLEYLIELPGHASVDVESVWIDIETRKVPVPTEIFIPNTKSELLNRRWQTFMVGVGSLNRGKPAIRILVGEEEGLLQVVGGLLDGRRAVYGATRDFDRMVLEGRFTNARRAHLPEPGPWPRLTTAPRWRNLGLTHNFPRGEDIHGKLVPSAWDRDQDERVLVHNLRDVIEVMLSDEALSLSRTCYAWMKSVMTDYEYAAAQLTEGI